MCAIFVPQMPAFLSFPWGFQRNLTIRAEVYCQLPLGKSTGLGMGEGQGENCPKSELIQHQSCLCAHAHYQKVLGLRRCPKPSPFRASAVKRRRWAPSSVRAAAMGTAHSSHCPDKANDLQHVHLPQNSFPCCNWCVKVVFITWTKDTRACKTDDLPKNMNRLSGCRALDLTFQKSLH